MTPDVAEYLKSLKASPKFGPQVVCHKSFKAVNPDLAQKLPDLAEPICALLKKRGMESLYTHQDKAIRELLKGNDILVATPTASGKSMIYNLPVLSAILTQEKSHALYLFPLKALAQDQHKVLEGLYRDLSCGEGSCSALYDGDTSSYQRRKIRETTPAVLLTNPEMVHLSFLPYHESWKHFFEGLKYIVIDEVHSYRGVLGSHMAWLLRRLQRIAAHYGSRPTFVLLSATIGNPKELGSALIGHEVKVITKSGAPQAEKNMVFLNPWDSAASTASQLLEAAVKRGLRTIVYTGSRKMTELINLWTSPKLGELATKLSAYRAGFLPEERREIESMLFSGELLGVISTSALELGIDIGDLDLCILVGYPGSVMATWQRGGRVGRSQRNSAIVLIAQEDALDQYFMRNPEDFFARKPESAIINPGNNTIMSQQLICAAAELPLSLEETCCLTPEVQQCIKVLAQKGSLLELVSGNRWVSPRKYPQREVTLRGGGVQMSIIDADKGEVIGEIDTLRGMKECHPGAIYLHRSKSWVVQRFDLDAGEIAVTKESPNYFTRPTIEKQTEILELLDTKKCFSVQVSFGRVRVRERVTGYQKRHNQTQKLISTIALDLPETVIETEGIWVDIHENITEKLEKEKLHFMGAIHAMEHGMIALFPLLVLCDRNDIGGISCPLHEQTESASVFVYDGQAGGVGLAKTAYEKIFDLLTETHRTVQSCGCENGCPSCVHSPKCGSGNRPIDKIACLFLLEEILSDKHSTAKPKRTSHSATKSEQSPALAAKESMPSNISVRGLDVLPKKYGVFDLETIRSAQEVGGWNRAERMGMSLGVVYDSELDDYVTYLEHEAAHLAEHLKTFDLVVGFNNKRFDNRVLAPYTDINLTRLPALDLLEEVHKYLGYRLSLNGIATETLGTKKSGDGLQALEWYKEGRIDLIQHYCKKDVELTRNLLLHGLEQGHLLFANKAKQTVRLPLTLDRSIAAIISAQQKAVN